MTKARKETGVALGSAFKQGNGITAIRTTALSIQAHLHRDDSWLGKELTPGSKAEKRRRFFMGGLMHGVSTPDWLKQGAQDDGSEAFSSRAAQDQSPSRSRSPSKAGQQGVGECGLEDGLAAVQEGVAEGVVATDEFDFRRNWKERSGLGGRARGKAGWYSEETRKSMLEATSKPPPVELYPFYSVYDELDAGLKTVDTSLDTSSTEGGSGGIGLPVSGDAYSRAETVIHGDATSTTASSRQAYQRNTEGYIDEETHLSLPKEALAAYSELDGSRAEVDPYTSDQSIINSTHIEA